MKKHFKLKKILATLLTIAALASGLTAHATVQTGIMMQGLARTVNNQTMCTFVIESNWGSDQIPAQTGSSYTFSNATMIHGNVDVTLNGTLNFQQGTAFADVITGSSFTVTIESSSLWFYGATVQTKSGNNVSGCSATVSSNNHTLTVTIPTNKTFGAIIVDYVSNPPMTNSNTTVTVPQGDYWVSNSSHKPKPEPTVVYGQTTLVKDTDYTLSWSNNSSAGTGTVTVTGIGNYAGSATGTFPIRWARYYVHFDKNHDDATGTMSDQAFQYGVAQSLSANAFSREGFTFAGWNTQPDGSGASYSDGEAVTGLTSEDGAVIDLYAQWTATLNTCPAPTNLTVVDSLLTATTAGLNWHGSIDVDNYTVRYRVPEHIEGGINETFEATSIPMDWAMYTGHLDTVMIRPSALTPATYGWAFGTLNGVFDNHARVNIYSNNQRWLVTPPFTLGSGTFTFDMALTKYSGTLLPVVDSLQQDDKFIVLISTDNMTTWTILREWNNSGSSYVYNNITCSAEGEQVSIDLSAYVGQRVRIAFYGESTNPTDMANTGGDNNLHIDNVIVGNPTVVPDSDWQTTGATATNLTLTGLTPETTYEAQVKSTCSDPEEWSNVVTFTTMVPVLVPEVTVSNSDQTVCLGDSIEDMIITATNGTITSVTGLPAGVEWSGTTISGTPTVSGTFNVTVTVSSDQTPDCGEETATATITVNPLPEVTVTNNVQTICMDNQIQEMEIIYSNGTIESVTGLPENVNWSDTPSGATIFGAPAEYGTFNATVTVTSDQGCGTATADVTITVKPNPEVTVSNNFQTVCENSAITAMEITATHATIENVTGLPTGVSWSKDSSGATGTISGTPTASGTYNVTVTVNSDQTPSCGIAYAYVRITVNPLPEVTVTNDNQTVCAGDAIVAMEITATNGTIANVEGLPAGLTWSGTMISGTPTVTGTFNVTVTVSSDQTPDCGEETATATITVNPLPEVTVTNNVQTICMDNQIQEMEIIYSNGTIESVTGLPENVNWSDTPSGATIFGAPAEYGTFNATVTVTSDQGCGTATADVTITVKPNPEVTVSNNFQTVCENSAITAMEITATHATIENVTGLPTGVSWSKDSSGATGTISGTPTASGTYNVTVTVNSDQTPSCGIAYAYVRITVNPLPEVTVTNDNQTVCAGDAIVAMEITATNGTIANVEGLPAGVTWSGTMISGTPTESGTFNVTVMVDSYYGCGIGMAELTIIVNPLPEAYTLDITGYGDSDGGWNLIASPLAESIAATEVGNLVAETASDFDLYRFNQAANMEWENWKQEESEHYHFNLESGQGYLYASKEDVTLIFTGEPYSDNGEVRLSKTTGVDFEGWNLVGNPFSDTAYIERPFYIMNSSGSEIIAAADVEQNSIAPMEGVFVIATEDGETLTFTTEAPSKSGKGLALNLSQGRGVIDRAIVRFGEGQQLPKFQLRESSTKVYIPQDNKDYAVVNVGRDAMHCVSTEIPVHFKARENGVYTLTVSETFSSQLSAFSYLHLIDNLTGNDVDLLETQSYTFEAKVTDYASRFKLVFATGDADNSEDFAFISNGNIIINGEGTLQVIDVLGRVIVPVDGRTRCVPTDAMSAGVYVLRLINGEDVKTQKIVIK